jgi:hypothetical protein
VQVFTQVQSRFTVDRTRDALDAAATGQATDVWLGDAHDVVTEDFPSMLLASNFSSIDFGSPRFGECVAYLWRFGAAEDCPSPMLARPRPPFPPMEVLPLTPFPPCVRFGGGIVVLSSFVECSAVDMC